MATFLTILISGLVGAILASVPAIMYGYTLGEEAASIEATKAREKRACYHINHYR